MMSALSRVIGVIELLSLGLTDKELLSLGLTDKVVLEIVRERWVLGLILSSIYYNEYKVHLVSQAMWD